MMATRCAVVLACVALALPARVIAQDSTGVRKATITYLTSTSAYINAGRDGGLQEGMEVRVWRGGTAIGVLKVSYLGPHQASCDIVSQSVAIVVGDTVRFRPVAAAVPPSVAEAAPVATPRPPRLGSSLRGNVGMHYMLVNQVGGGGFTQPSMDVRLNGPLAGSPVVLNVDVRARRTASTIGGTDVVDGHARAYQLALSFGAPTGMGRRLTVGRQTSPGFSGVGVFDGVLGEWSGKHGGGGIFGGTQPDPVDLSFATSIVEAGGYFERHGSIGSVASRRRWTAVMGLIGSYERGHANREFGFVQGSYASARVFGFLSQEIDYYRPWKRTTGMPAVSFTSTFATLRYRATDKLDLRAGFDNRQNVLLYRDVVNPVTTFDDAFRQGVWVGMGLRISPRYFLDADTRRSDGGTAGTASSYTLSLRAARFLMPEVGARARITYYRNQRIDGVLESVALGLDPGSAVHVELSGGARTERDRFAAPASQTAFWVGGDFDVSVARAWYLMLSASTEHGGLAPTSQVYTGFSVRF
jgi:hypothetical protein